MGLSDKKYAKKHLVKPSLSNPIGKLFNKNKSKLTGMGNTLLLPGLAMAGARVRSNSTCGNRQILASSSSNVADAERKRHYSTVSARSSHNLQLGDFKDLRKSATQLRSNSRLNDDQKKMLFDDLISCKFHKKKHSLMTMKQKTAHTRTSLLEKEKAHTMKGDDAMG